jgi:hypothetical protein
MWRPATSAMVAESRAVVRRRRGDPLGVYNSRMTEDHGRRVSIRWNGREVSDPAELPPEVRKLLQDADGNGIPDVLEPGKASAGERLEVKIVEPTVIELDGKSYRSVDDLPAEMRESVRAALARAGARGLSASSNVGPTSPPSFRNLAVPARSRGPSWAVVLLAAIAGAVITYLLLRAPR